MKQPHNLVSFPIAFGALVVAVTSAIILGVQISVDASSIWVLWLTLAMLSNAAVVMGRIVK